MCTFSIIDLIAAIQQFRCKTTFLMDIWNKLYFLFHKDIHKVEIKGTTLISIIFLWVGVIHQSILLRILQTGHFHFRVVYSFSLSGTYPLSLVFYYMPVSATKAISFSITESITVLQSNRAPKINKKLRPIFHTYLTKRLFVRTVIFLFGNIYGLL